jgi:hypothetical protein
MWWLMSKKKSKWIRVKLKNSLTYILWKKINPTRKIKVVTFENNVRISSLSFHSCLLVQFFVICFWIHVFSNMYHILSPYETSSNEKILKCANSRPQSMILLHKPIIICLVYIYWISLVCTYLFKLATLFHNFFIALMILPYIYGIWIKYIL